MTFFGIVCVLSVLLTAVSSQGVSKESAGCQYDYYADKALDGSQLKKVKSISSFDACVAECAKYNDGEAKADQKCNAVNYFSKTSVCLVINLPADQSTASAPYASADVHTGIIKKCKAAPSAPTGPRPSYTNCGKQDPDYMPELGNNKRIVKGSEAKEHSWPWMLRLENSTGCGATLIPVRDDLDSSDMAITATHCFMEISNKGDYTTYYVRAGKHVSAKTEDTEISVNVAKVKFYNTGSTRPDDLAIISLKSPIKFTKAIRPVCLPAANEPLAVDKTCVATGWGRNSTSPATSPGFLKQGTMSTKSDEECKKLWGSQYISPNHTCAGDGIADTCQGDSGGPLVCQDKDTWIQYGITSFGNNECDGKTPGMFVRVQTYIGWIQDAINEMSSLAKS